MPQKKEYDDRNRGALFVNDKEGNEKRPDKTGKLLINVDDFTPDKDGNVLIYLSAWINNTKSGEVLSIVAQPPKQ